jgi:signal peptidase II
MDTSPASSSSANCSQTSVDSPRVAAVAPRNPKRSYRGGLSRLTVVVATLVLVADQVTKWLVINHVNEPVHVLWTLQLVKAYNTGTAFSLGVGLGPFIGLLAVGVVVMLVRLGRAVVNPVGLTALGLVLGGAVGNLIDRLFRESHGFMHGAVVDFIDLQWWPVFNLADSAIVIGGFLLVMSGFGSDRVARGPLPPGRGGTARGTGGSRSRVAAPGSGG